MSNRLHWRMLLIALVPVTIVSIGLSLTILNIGFTDLQAAMDRHSTSQVNQLAGAAEFPLVSGDTAALTNTARKLLDSDGDARAVAIFDRSGKALVQIGELPENAALLGAHTGPITRAGALSILVRTIEPPTVPLDDFYQGNQSTPMAN